VLVTVLHRHVAPGSRLVLGLSGGVDSVALLHVLTRCQASYDFDLCCIHVHHGLSPNADAWATFCADWCRHYGVALDVQRVQIDRADPAGIEAAARVARHRVFAALDADFVLTAHHRDDQAETLLLQLLRGAGPKGLAAMAETQQRHGWHAVLLRPFLELTRAEIEHYARLHQLLWIEDESNADTAFNRNYLRHAVLPTITARFPSAATTLARSAALQADAATLLHDLALLDAERCVSGDRLDCVALGTLSTPRARNLLRWFIAQRGLAMTSERRLDEALRQLLHAAADAHVRVIIQPGYELRRYRHAAMLIALRDCAVQPLVTWQGEASVRLVQAANELAMNRAVGAGLSLARLNAGRVEIGMRQGGERLRLAAQGSLRSLKNLLQEADMPPWQRACLPLLWCDGELVWAAGIGFDPAYRAHAHEMGIVPTLIVDTGAD
jgi:tRNA(Ile)-lysidine synthase